MHGVSHQHEPVWVARRELRYAQLPAGLTPWLFDPGSLTARLIAFCPDGFHVRVQSQLWRVPMHNEIRRLGMRERQTSFIREVYLCCGEQPLVFARTVIPGKTLSGRQRHLADLGSRPLGAVLFADPNMRRDEIEVACLGRSDRLYQKAVAVLSHHPERIWGRRSVFYLGHRPLLVNEIFLPAIQVDNTGSAERDC